MFVKLSLYIDIICLLFIYFLFFYPNWKSNRFKLFSKTMLYIYLIFVAYFTLILPFYVPIPLVNVNYSHLNINLVPFLDIMSGRGNSIAEIILNIFMFIPFGILYPFIYNKNLKKTLVVSMTFSIIIECCQLLSVRQISTCDITDVIMNTSGACLGYFIYIVTQNKARTIISYFFPDKESENFQPYKIKHRNKFLLLIIVFSLIRSIMILFI